MNDAASAAPSDDDTMADYWRDVKPAMQEASQQRRASNRANSAALLRANGVPFESKNGGAHLIVEGRECPIDFWPGTGKWHSRCGKKGFGVRNLVAFIGAPNAQSKPPAESGSA